MTAVRSARGGPARPSLVAALVLLGVLFLGCNVALGEARRGDEPFRPIGDQLASALSTTSFPWTPAPGETTGEIVEAPAGAVAEAGPSSARVGAGGTGVSLRSDCADAARAGGAWADNTQVTVVEYGSGRCGGWTRVSAGSVASWVRDEYLQGLPPAGERSELAPRAAILPQFEQLQAWTARLQDGAGRLALLSRHAPESAQSDLSGTFVEAVRDEMRTLSTEIGEAAPVPVCDAARRPLLEGANALADLAQRMRPAFAPDGQVASGLEPLVTRYAAAQSEAARLLAECAPD